MAEKLQQAIPLTVAFGILALGWIEIALNFSFHWNSNGDPGNGLGLPASLCLVAPAAFVAWGLEFAACADAATVIKVTIGSIIDSVAGRVLMAVAPATAELPNFWGIALGVGVLGFGAVILSVFDRYYAPATLGAFAAVVFCWTATGLDHWAQKGGGVGSGLKSPAAPAAAGHGRVRWSALHAVRLGRGELRGLSSRRPPSRLPQHGSRGSCRRSRRQRPCPSAGVGVTTLSAVGQRMPAHRGRRLRSTHPLPAT
ncbi:hypothetical protein JOF29_002839 [Kribbella aluminosa]|uniref:Uncharacterized protein n=1 Tax=Kribbella aluminosa TaxID=416017 RepID=A0ABS4UJC1_9ACTN|nr:hypothetical protein [Kribbella aluminosa]MBP2351756.1 hypothetical protein [Kribbella aluminosa]